MVHILTEKNFTGDTDTYHQANVTLTVVGTGDAARCEEVLAKILEPADAVHCSPRPCAIGDRFQPPVGSLPFYAFSAFLYAPKGLDAVEADDTLNITKLRQNAWKYCGLVRSLRLSQLSLSLCHCLCLCLCLSVCACARCV